MQITILDGQGGGLGKALAERLRQEFPHAFLIAAGTNALATSAMMKGGAQVGATGENAICYNCGHTDLVVAPFGFLLPNALYGEVTPAMAQAVAQCKAPKVLIPVNHYPHGIYLAGMGEHSLTKSLEDAMAQIHRLFPSEDRAESSPKDEGMA